MAFRTLFIFHNAFVHGDLWISRWVRLENTLFRTARNSAPAHYADWAYWPQVHPNNFMGARWNGAARTITARRHEGIEALRHWALGTKRREEDCRMEAKTWPRPPEADGPCHPPPIKRDIMWHDEKELVRTADLTKLQNSGPPKPSCNHPGRRRNVIRCAKPFDSFVVRDRVMRN